MRLKTGKSLIDLMVFGGHVCDAQVGPIDRELGRGLHMITGISRLLRYFQNYLFPWHSWQHIYRHWHH